ncbi:MAG: tetratricopeptide repeat protein, partial [Endomicrobiia bacterium]
KSKYAGYALYLKANFLYEKGDFQQAKEVCLNFLNFKKPKTFILPMMYILAQCFLNLNNFDEAIKIYNEIIQKYPEHYLIARIYESLAICYELKGDIQSSKQIYERMNILYPGSYWAEIAQQKLKGM